MDHPAGDFWSIIHPKEHHMNSLDCQEVGIIHGLIFIYFWDFGNVHIGHQRWVWDCAFSVDGAYLVTGMWNLAHIGWLVV